MKHLPYIIALLIVGLHLQIEAQSTRMESCRLTMIIPNHFVQAGTGEGVANYRSSKYKSSLTMKKRQKDAQDGFITALAAADHAYNELVGNENITGLKVLSERVGKTDFVIVSWLNHENKRGPKACMAAFNSDCELIYSFKMNSQTSNQKDLNKLFRSFQKSCRLTETN